MSIVTRVMIGVDAHDYEDVDDDSDYNNYY